MFENWTESQRNQIRNMLVVGVLIDLIYIFWISPYLAQAQTSTFTPWAVDTEVAPGIHKRSVDSNVRYVYEDSQWKSVKEANSLKNATWMGQPLFEINWLNIDPDYTIVEIADYDYYCIKKLKVKSTIEGDIPFKLNGVPKNIVKVDKKDDEIEIEDLCFEDGLLNQNISWGLTSTKLSISDASNIVDVRIRTDANEDFGGAIRWEHGIPAGQTVINATQSLYLYDEQWAIDDDLEWRQINDIYWNATTGTTDYNAFDREGINSTTLNHTNNNDWTSFNVTDAVKGAYDRGDGNVSFEFWDADWSCSAGITQLNFASEMVLGNWNGGVDYIKVKSEDIGGETPVLEIWYEAVGGAPAGCTGVSISTWLNGTDTNRTDTYGNAINITGLANATVPVEMWVNGSLWLNGTERVEENRSSDWFPVGAFNITLNWHGNDTYCPGYNETYLFVQKDTTTLSLAINGTEGNAVKTYPQASNTTAWAGITGGTTTLLRNGTSIANPYYAQLGAGYYNFTATFSHQNFSAPSVSRFLTLQKSAVSMSLASSNGWVVSDGISTTITGTSNVSITLDRDGVVIANPYTFTATTGLYTFTITVDDLGNYTPSSTSQTLTVISGGYGCIDNYTFAYYKEISSPGFDYTLVNFTDLFINNQVNFNLTDVWVNTSGATYWVNSSYPYSLVVNHTGLSSFLLEFGNYYRNVSHDVRPVPLNIQNDTLSTYNDYGNHSMVEFYSEIDGTYMLPPNANNTLTLYCAGGSTMIPLHNQTRILIPYFMELDWMRATTRYSASDFYFRTLQVHNLVDDLDFFMVNAQEYQVDQVEFTLYDYTGNYGNSRLEIKRYLDGALETITEFDFDITSNVLTYLIDADVYRIYVDNDIDEIYIGELMVSTTDLDKTIILGSQDQLNRQYANISWSYAYNGTDLTFSWMDYEGGTNQIEFWVVNSTNTSQIFAYNVSTNATNTYFSFHVPVVNATYMGMYKLKHDQFGNETTINSWYYTLPESLFPAMSFPLIGLLTALGASPMLWITLLMVMPVGMAFDQKHAGIGGIAMIGIAWLFSMWFSYIAVSGLLTIALVIAVILEIQQKRKGG